MMASFIRNIPTKNYQNPIIGFKLQSIMLGMFFSGFLFISTHISLDLLSLGSAKTYIGLGENLNRHLMASCVVNIYTKNY